MKNKNLNHWSFSNNQLEDYNTYHLNEKYTTKNYKTLKHMLSLIKDLYDEGKVSDDDFTQLVYYTISIYTENQVKYKIDEFYNKALEKYFFRNNEIYGNKS